jgi:hypothetical protein
METVGAALVAARQAWRQRKNKTVIEKIRTGKLRKWEMGR